MDGERSKDQGLGRVTEDLDVPRGPDVSFEISVPEDWMRAGASLVIARPRRVTCRACGGGGCDACARSGAFVVDAAALTEPLEVALPALESPPALLTIRLPGLGIPATTAELPPGHLFLEVRRADRPSPGVARSLVHEPKQPAQAVMRMSLLVAIGLSLLFLFLLRLSGWI